MKQKLTILLVLIIVQFQSCIFFPFDIFYSGESSSIGSQKGCDESTSVKFLREGSSIDLEGVRGKKIYYAVINYKSEKIKPSGYVLNFNANINEPKAEEVSKDSIRLDTSASSGKPHGPVHCISPLLSSVPVIEVHSRNARAVDLSQKQKFNRTKEFYTSYKEKPLKATTDEFYVDVDSSITGINPRLEKKEATLYAKGIDKDSGELVCLVWVINEYAKELSNGETSETKVSVQVAQDIADSFAENYKLERAVLGEEYEGLLGNDGSINESFTLKEYGPHGNYINFIIYDIGNDLSSENKTGIAAYFYSKDYYDSDSMQSNRGKFLYLDSHYCNHTGVDDSGNDIFDADNDECSKIMLSTIFHEYQHMINFSNKEIRNELEKKDTWYDEMLSMLTEDFFMEHLGIAGEAGSVVNQRVPGFNDYYWACGVGENLTGNNAILNYFTSYTFGAFLVRNFGGMKLMKEMSQNPYVNWDSVINAIKKVTGTTYTKKQLLESFVQACIFKPDYAVKNEYPIFNKECDYIEELNIVKFTPFDLYSQELNSTYTVKEANGSVPGIALIENGPLFFARNNYSETIPPLGFNLHYAGIAKTQSITLNFSSSVSESVNIMVIVQDE